MTTPAPFDGSWVVRELARTAMDRVTKGVVRSLQGMTDLLSGDDSELRTTWGEICVQVQVTNRSTGRSTRTFYEWSSKGT